MCVTPSQFFSSLRSMQSVSPSHRQRRGIHNPSTRHWNSSVWQPPGGRVAVERKKRGIKQRVYSNVQTNTFLFGWKHLWTIYSFISFKLLVKSLHSIKNPRQIGRGEVLKFHQKLWVYLRVRYLAPSSFQYTGKLIVLLMLHQWQAAIPWMALPSPKFWRQNSSFSQLASNSTLLQHHEVSIFPAISLLFNGTICKIFFR